MQQFSEIWLIDFEFIVNGGNLPEPVCMVGVEYYSGKEVRIWREELLQMEAPPFPSNADTLVVAFYASAEVGCYLALGWDLPVNVLDLYTEFSCLTNGRRLPSGRGLLGALAYYGISGIADTEKDASRELVMGGGPWSVKEQQHILDYCQSDVVALKKMLCRMESEIDFPRALIRGRYMRCAAVVERNGIPLDTDSLSAITANWDAIKARLIQDIDAEYGVYEGQTFKVALFRAYLAREGIAWPCLESGALDLKEDIFKDITKKHPKLIPLKELRNSLSKMRLNALQVGEDGRNRYLLSAFRSKTGRNQPSNKLSIFGPASWLRYLIKPTEGNAIAYIDWSQQEFGISAALSGDEKMQEAYLSGDPYLTFAKQAGAVPLDATKKSHANERELFKGCVLAVNYGMGVNSLAKKIDQPIYEVKKLLTLHRKTYKVFWDWSDAVVTHAMLHSELTTTFGWKIAYANDPKEPAIRNFPMQANGAEMLRLAIIFATERGIKICAPVHDALLIEAPSDVIDEHVRVTKTAMSDASAVVLDGFRLETEEKIVSFPDRYEEERGEIMWKTVNKLVLEV